MARDPIVIYGGLPTGRKVDRPDSEDDYVGTVRRLPRADKSALKVLRRNGLEELDARKLKQRGSGRKVVWVDGKTDREYTLVKSHVDPLAPEESGVDAFAVSDGNILYFKPLGTEDRVDSVYVGTFGAWKT